MSRAPRVKINNNLQVAVCRRVGWLSLQRQLFSGSVHGYMVSVLSRCRWRLNLRLDITTEKIQAFVQKTLSFCVSPLAGPLPNDSPCILMFYSCIGVRYLVLSWKLHQRIIEKVSKVLIWSLFLDGSTGESHIQKLMTRWEKELKSRQNLKMFPFEDLFFLSMTPFACSRVTQLQYAHTVSMHRSRIRNVLKCACLKHLAG